MSDIASDPLLSLVQGRGLVDDLQLEEVIQEHKRSGKPTGQILADFGLLDVDSQLQIIADQLGTEVRDINESDLTPEVIQAIPADTARMYQCLPVAVYGETVQVALGNPLNPSVVDDISFVAKKEIITVV